MTRFQNCLLILRLVAIIAIPAPPISASQWLARDFLDVPVSPMLREYCHVVRFTEGWRVPKATSDGQPLTFGYDADYEFRIDGLTGRRFLVGEYYELVEVRYYARNRYRVDLLDPSVALPPPNAREWEDAAVVPFFQKSILKDPLGPPYGPVKDPRFNGHVFQKSGKFWAMPTAFGTRLSPDSSVVVLQSYTPVAKKEQMQDEETVFFDVFDTGIGRKIVTIQGKYVGVQHAPEECLKKTGWVTERYFVIPLGQRKERCLVCEFGARRKTE